MFKIEDEPEPPNEGACLRCLMNGNRHMRGPYLRYMMSRNSQMRRVGVFKIYDGSES